MIRSGPESYVPARPSAVGKEIVAPKAEATAPAPSAAAWDGAKPFVPEAHAPQFPPQQIPREMLDGFRPAAATAFDLADVSVQETPMLQQGADTLVQVSIANTPRVVRLQPYSMRAESARLVVQLAGGVLVEQAWPAPATYRGVVEGMPAMEVAASIRDGEVSMLVHSTDPLQHSWYVQPLKDALPGMPPGLHVVYRDVDVIPRNAECGWSALGAVPPLVEVPGGAKPDRAPLAQRLNEQMPTHRPAALPSKDDGHAGHADGGDEGGVAGDEGTIAVANIRAQIGLDADVEFYQANGSSVLNTIYDMEMIMNSVGLVYQNQVAIAYTETVLFVRTAEPDPYTSTNANTLLCQFGEWWNTNVSTTRDVAHLFTGKDLDGTTVGLAWIGSVCPTNFNNCNASGSSLSYGLVQSRFTTDITSRFQDSCHELGHNWNACHCNTGGNCGGGSSSSNCGIMTSNISGQLTFDSAAVTAITGYRDGRPCLDVWQNPVYVNWSWAGSENGSISNPWNTIFEGLDACLVGGTMIVQGGNYLQNPNIFKAKNIQAVNGTVRIGN